MKRKGDADYRTPHLIATDTYNERAKDGMIYYLQRNEMPVTVELTDDERAAIKGTCAAFWLDVHFKVYKTALLSYIDSDKRDFDYVHCIGVYDTQYIAGRKLYEALNCPEYLNRPRVSAKRSGVFLLMGGYKFLAPSQIQKECERAIAHWRKQQVQRKSEAS